MQIVSEAFSFALRFHPDVAEMSPKDFQHHCYVKLLRREPEQNFHYLTTLTMDKRSAYLGSLVSSEEFGGGSLPLSDDLLCRISQAAGWAAHNSAFHYACRYISLATPSYAAFVSRLISCLSSNTVPRSEIDYVAATCSDTTLVRSLLDGLIDLSAEFTMAMCELDSMKKRISELESAARQPYAS
jgi:hypothetical protein